jgi:hypothetical protein
MVSVTELHYGRLGVGIPQWYSAGLRSESSGVRVPAGTGNFSLHRHIQTGSEAHPASYPMGTTALSLGAQRPRREADHLLPFSVEVKRMH